MRRSARARRFEEAIAWNSRAPVRLSAARVQGPRSGGGEPGFGGRDAHRSVLVVIVDIVALRLVLRAAERYIGNVGRIDSAVDRAAIGDAEQGTHLVRGLSDEPATGFVGKDSVDDFALVD